MLCMTEFTDSDELLDADSLVFVETIKSPGKDFLKRIESYP